jgi:hypothetical protein
MEDRYMEMKRTLLMQRQESNCHFLSLILVIVLSTVFSRIYAQNFSNLRWIEIFLFLFCVLLKQNLKHHIRYFDYICVNNLVKQLN